MRETSTVKILKRDDFVNQKLFVMRIRIEFNALTRMVEGDSEPVWTTDRTQIL